MAHAGITGKLLREKYCKEGVCTALAGNEAVQQTFEALYRSPKEMRLVYQRIKVLEFLHALSQMEMSREKYLTEYRAEQQEISYAAQGIP